MKIRQLHPWDVTPKEAIQIQKELSRLVSTVDEVSLVSRVAGVDISVRSDTIRAAVVVLSFPDMDLLETIVVEKSLEFKYIPGLLSFREAPAALEAFAAISLEPDLIMVDGQGIAHPRRLGIAAHLGLFLDKPTIGVAKSRLTGRHDEVGSAPGERVYLYDKEEVIGAVVRTKARTNPLYISTGHKIALETAIHYVFSSLKGYRLPEPVRRAHLAAGAVPGTSSQSTS